MTLIQGKIKASIRDLAYHTGLMGAWHRVRNRDTLTVFMFHRVLPTGSLEYERAEKEFTFSVAGFERVLDFVKRHYHVVAHDEIRSSIDAGTSLPRRAALITFDDGWRDTLTYALPCLRQRRLPAVLFLSTEVVTLQSDRWWQDLLVEVLKDRDMVSCLEGDLGMPGSNNENEEVRIKRISVALSALSEQERCAILGKYGDDIPMPRQMLCVDDLEALKPWISVAGHGHSHAPLSHHRAAVSELRASQSRLREWGGDRWAMSFPHGAYDGKTLTQANEAGFQVCYTSDPFLVRSAAHVKLSLPIGRIHIPENEWTCEDGTISESKLSTFLFLRDISS